MASSTAPPVDTSLQIIGYVALLLSCCAFGTMFVPLKRRNSKDGFFVQWIECGVIFIVGCIFYVARGFPKFEPIACIGGFLYATGNVFSVPIVEGIGMGVGFLIWTSLQIIVGWGVARFGLGQWIAPQNVKNDVLNYVGISLTIVSGVLLIFVKHVEPEPENEYSVTSKEMEHRDEIELRTSDSERSSFDMTGLAKKVPFILMAMVLACLHGLMMTPIEYLKQENPPTDNFQVFDYIFPFYTSVFLFSTIYFLSYCVLLRRRAYVERNLVIPSIGYGLLWTAGMTLWFVSSDKLSQVVAYPCTARLPPLISGALDVFVFKSIQGSRSFTVLAISSIVGVVSVILIALSNQI
ncbi:Protein CBG03472 [Caenorhabditis briggsae]|uniref:Uncharacterized protein n=2 Tax=Caenorhabditis briggsae TaxID=6238 RepID=A0AAE9D6L3_CAEBR|nr:Protein CBG03472 [Caenorhabditis briggsae]ULT96020.1 hypothetical protein L3Y34_004579 [Caenorhabditis briggsae]CAP24365.1 Protein CBG03472 [Caenorhabditis briggsae]